MTSKINNCAELRKSILSGEHEYLILLNGGVCSSKYIDVDSKGRFAVLNNVDSSYERLTGRELYTISNIGKAMKLGAFVLDTR